MHSGYPPKLVERCRKWMCIHGMSSVGFRAGFELQYVYRILQGFLRHGGMKGAELARKRHFKCLDMSHGRRFAHPTPARQVAITSNPGSDSVSGPFVPGRGSTLLWVADCA